MRIVVADQCVEHHIVQQAQHLGRAGAGDAAQQIEAGFQVGSTLVLVLHFRHHAECLAEILLVQAYRVALCIALAVIARDQQEAAVASPMNPCFGGWQLHRTGQGETEALIDHAVLDCVDRRFQDMRAGVSSQRQANALPVEHHRQFVLRACE
ncbi:hypothetical protein D3C78_1116350 [compost metagenome]